MSSNERITAASIDRRQRAAIYPHVISDLGIAISEANVALECGEWAAVQALRCRMEQDMRLLDDIGCSGSSAK